jgi:cardiolipin synthase
MNESKTDELRSDILTVPNLISAFRILLVPVFLWSILNRRSSEALIIFFIAGISDFLDGLTARLFHARSKLGMILDPAGDKFLLAVSTIALTIRSLATPNAIPIGLTLLIFGRDLLIVIGALIAFLSWRQTSFPPSFIGKFSTAFQLGTVFLVLLLNHLHIAPGWLNWFFGATAVLTVGSGVDYFRYGLRVLRERRRT